MKKIKLFVGAYINLSNSQNLNSLAICKYIDKSKFEVYALELFSGNLESQKGKMPGVKVLKCFYPHRISKYIGYFWGIFSCNVAYLPKGECVSFNHFLLRVFRRRSFSTIEGILDTHNLKSAIEYYGSYKRTLYAYSIFNKLFPITHFLGEYNKINHNIKCVNYPLFLGIDMHLFLNEEKKNDSLNNIIFIGKIIARKGIYDYVKIAERFPNLNFFIVGDGPEKSELIELLNSRGICNITLLGTVTPDELAIILKDINLHILPSRSEGFPKVLLETAASGVPSIVYSDYGAREWITDKENGLVVNTLDQIFVEINYFISNGESLKLMTENAIKLSKKYDWKEVIKSWEKEVINLYLN